MASGIRGGKANHDRNATKNPTFFFFSDYGDEDRWREEGRTEGEKKMVGLMLC